MDPEEKLVSFPTLTGCAISPLPMWEKPLSSSCPIRQEAKSLRLKPIEFSNLQAQPGFADRRQNACITKEWR